MSWTPTLLLTRFAYAPDGTFGRLLLPDGLSCVTAEPPWRGNEPFVSCIPDGVYTLRKRRSDVVERTTEGRYTEGWEVTDVPGRTFIMMHPANWPRQLEGCIAPGEKYKVMQGANGVTNSGKTFDKLMAALASRQEWLLDIRPFIMEHP